MKIVVTFVLLGLFCSSAFAETITLKSGNVITAKILERADDYVKVDFNDVILTYYKDEILSIESDPVPFLAPVIDLPRSSALESTNQSISNLIEKVSQSVVVVEVRKANSKIEGTGFFISSDGLIVTNLHVVFKASSIQIRTKNGSTYPARMVTNYNDQLDICVLKINIANSPALPLGDSDQLKRGQIIFTIGHREGSRYQTSSGPFVEKVMIDGEENLKSNFVSGHGNSGGPILDQNGTIVGISKAYSPDTGHNFGIPINVAKRFLNYNDALTIEDFNKQISPANELTYTGQGILLEGRYGEALDYFKKALALDSNYLKAWVGSAKAYRLMLMEEEELAAWQEIHQRDSANVQAYVRIGKISLNRGLIDAAIENLQKAIDLATQSADVYGDLGYAYGQKGNLAQAIVAYKMAIQLDPQNGDSHYNLAVAYFNKRAFKSARIYSDKAMSLGYAVPESFIAELKKNEKYGNSFEVK
ncbi:MAG: trypsin-like peptidase domain-containing protein [Candidatus Omnitrophica bacterium]|nr:trypsin-like peptidase domain-containing protein [Candidatus Omnitrophota bacterium]